MSIAQFPPASLDAQLSELIREREDRRARRDAMETSSRRITERQAEHFNNSLDGAIGTLRRLVEAQRRGEPGRNEIVAALRTARRRLEELGLAVDWLDELLAKLPEAT